MSKTESTQKIVEFDALMVHIDSDLDLLRELRELFQDYYPDQVKDIYQAIHSQDCSSIRETAHQLKGALSNFHAVDALETARQLEFAGRDQNLESAMELVSTLETQIQVVDDYLEDLCESE